MDQLVKRMRRRLNMLIEAVEQWDDGGHTHDHFDNSCQVCLLLADLRSVVRGEASTPAHRDAP